MTIALHWFLPTSGDSRNVVPGAGGHGRPATVAYLTQIARAADDLGFDAVLTPTGTHCEDAWLVTTALSQQTSRLRFLVAFRPGITNPTLAAQQAGTFQRLTGGRLPIVCIAPIAHHHAGDRRRDQRDPAGRARHHLTRSRRITHLKESCAMTVPDTRISSDVATDLSVTPAHATRA